MINTKDFCTRTDYIPRKNADTGKYWGIALDIGYSSVKGMSPNSVFCFPAFAKEFTGQMLSIDGNDPSHIQYRDENGQVWNVGSSAQNSISTNDTNNSLQSLYGRNRYDSAMFKVLARVGVAMGLMQNEYGDPANLPIAIQTGLPPAYLQNDAPVLKDIIAGEHNFELQIGKSPWRKFSFAINEDNIRVMAQPMGSFFSAVFTNETKPAADASAILSANVLVFDAGFGTVDTYSIRNRQIENASNSFDDCGMKAVLQETADLIQKRLGAEVKVHAMQKHLQEGTVPRFNIRKMESENMDFANLLEEANTKVCMNALEHMKSAYNFLMDYDYLLVTGGTGAAWYDMICDHFSKMQTLKVITGSKNDQLSHIYSNVRGYYLHQAGRLRRT